jgi:hypothetical protein
MMKKILLAITLLALMPSISMADASAECSACHSGAVAPALDALKAKFKTADALVAGAKATTNPMMAGIQKDDAKLKAAAEAIFK